LHITDNGLAAIVHVDMFYSNVLLITAAQSSKHLNLRGIALIRRAAAA
jgi:hypothetical protein